jgi:hypothetical protein
MGLKHGDKRVRKRAKHSADKERGLQCRQCGCQQFRVVYTRAAWGAMIVRRRECRNCRERLTTWERAIGEHSRMLDNLDMSHGS